MNESAGRVVRLEDIVADERAVERQRIAEWLLGRADGWRGQKWVADEFRDLARRISLGQHWTGVPGGAAE